MRGALEGAHSDEGRGALEVTAALALARGEWELGARLEGASEPEGPASSFRREPADERFMTPLIARASEALGDGGFAAAREAGRRLGAEEALEQARSWLGSLRGS